MNDIINFLQIKGLKLWLNADLPITLTKGTNIYYLSDTSTIPATKPLRVIDAYYSDSNQVQRPLIPLSWSDWDRLSQRTQLGAINSYFVDKQQTSLNVSVWLTPDSTAASGLLHLIVQEVG